MGNESERHIGEKTGEARPRSARHDAPMVGRTGEGEALDPAARAYFEPRFGHDFSQVRVHHDASAADSASGVDALAYTDRRDIVFGAGQYSPATAAGRRLLAHELAHVVQQAATPSATPQSKPIVGESSSAAERIADEAASVLTHPQVPPQHSAALRIREQLRAYAVPGPLIQRVPTWGGKFETDKYEPINQPDADGVDIELRFTPDERVVDAERIGLVQSVRSSEQGVAFAVGSGAKKRTLESRQIPAGEAGAGTSIDRKPEYANPLYATLASMARDSLADTTTIDAWGQHGWRYRDRAGEHKQDALLKDTPKLLSDRKESKQIFETAALAIKGAQAGTYYGSVQWGWEKDAAGLVSKIPFAVVSNDVPSAVFTRASEMWNASKTSGGEDTIDLPKALGKYTNTASVWLVRDHKRYKATLIGKLDKNTRLEMTSEAGSWGKATVIDGPQIGKVGWVMKSLMSDAKS